MFSLLIDWQNIWQQIVNFGKTIGLRILEVIGILILGIIVIKILMKILNKIFSKTKMPKVTYKFLLNVLRFALYLLLLIIICQVVGIPITGFVAVVSAAGLALSLALQDSLSNLANGVVIISTRPFKEGDYIKIEDIEGTVAEIKMLYTIIDTTDNKRVSIPNSLVVDSELINYSTNPTRRVSFSFEIDYASDVEKAKKIILDVMTNCNKVLIEPKAPFCSLYSLNASSITLNANCWCLNADYWDVYYFVMDNVFNELKRNNISIPFNQMEVRLRTDEVTMPVRQDEMAKRDESVAVKVVEKVEDDVFDKVIKNITKKRKSKKKQK